MYMYLCIQSEGDKVDNNALIQQACKYIQDYHEGKAVAVSTDPVTTSVSSSASIFSAMPVAQGLTGDPVEDEEIIKDRLVKSEIEKFRMKQVTREK